MARVVPKPKQPPPQFTTKPGTKFRGYKTLTKPEFQAWAKKQPKKPGGRSYENYRTFLEKYRAGYTKPSGGGGGGKTTTKKLTAMELMLRLQTPKQMEAQANRMANAQMEAQKKFLLAQSAQERADALLQMQSVAAAGRAAAAQNAGLFGMVGGEYNAAAGEIRGMGTNLSNQMADTTAGQVLAANAGLGQLGAPDVLVGGPAGANTVAGAPQAHVAAYQGGELPGQAISNAGEAAQFGLAGMVAAQNLRATQEGTAGYITAIRDLNKNQRLELLKIASTRPELVQGILDKLIKRNEVAYTMRREIETSIQQANAAQRALDFKYAELQQDAVTAQDKLKLDRWYKQQKLAIDQYRASIYAQNAATSAYNADTSRMNAQTNADKANASGTGDTKGRTWMATVSNQTALLPTRLKGTDAAFNWVWSRIVNKIPKKNRAEARKWLLKQLKQIAAASSGSSSTGGGDLNTGTPPD